MSKIVKISKMGESHWAVPIALPSGPVDVKAYCKVNPNGMLLSEADFTFAVSNGFQALIASGVVIISDNTDEKKKVRTNEIPISEQKNKPELKPGTEIRPEPENKESDPKENEDKQEDFVEEASDESEDSNDSQEDDSKSKKSKSRKGSKK